MPYRAKYNVSYSLSWSVLGKEVVSLYQCIAVQMRKRR
jgi:hypothetical protein